MPSQLQILVPCGRCGAAMRESAGAHPPQVTCVYCGAHEQIPADQAARVTYLRQRLAAARFAAGEADLVIARMLEGHDWIRGTARAALVPLAVLVYWTVQSVSAARSSGNVASLATSLRWLLFLLIIVAGLIVGYQAVARRYRTKVRTRFLARPPTDDGAPLRCRCCGGDLPVAYTAFATCAFCGAPNLASPDVLSRRRELLEREAAQYRVRAAGEVVEPARALSFGVMAWYLGVFVCGFFLSERLARVVAPFILSR